MNDKLKQNELERRLEQATAIDPQSALDPTTAAWRESWLAWGKSLESGETINPEILKQLLDIPNSGMSKVRKNSTGPRRTWAWYSTVISAAVAASLLLVIGALKFLPSGDLPMKNMGSSGKFIAKETPKIPSLPTKINITTAPSVSKENEENFAWDDALDSRMTSLQEQLALSQYDSASLGYRFDSVRSRLESLSKEIEQSPL
jgi:hypothetical protein